ncbi:MAG: ATP-binding protein [Bdellovibrionota bacterium]
MTFSSPKNLLSFWKDLSISKRFYIVIGTMAVLIASELIVLQFAMRTLSAVRAFVGGESLWSKGQKDSAFHLQRYGVNKNPEDYKSFLVHLRVPEGDHQARIELLKKNPNMVTVRDGFLAGHIHGDDIEPIVHLLRTFYWEPHLAKAIQIWEEADNLITEFKAAGIEYYREVRNSSTQAPNAKATFAKLRTLNDQLTAKEEEFSYVLGAGSRWLEYMVVSILIMAVLTVEAIGLTLTFLTTRYLSRGLSEVTTAAKNIGEGKFHQQIPVTSKDEIGQLATAVNQMGALLKRSHGELEQRVSERTQELALLAQENAALYREAQEALHTRDEFMSIASHEIKTPLTSLSLQLQLLLRHATNSPDCPEKEQITKMALACVRQSRRLAVLSEELMDLTRIRLGKLELKKERCDLTGLVSEIVSQLGNDAANAGSNVSLHADGPVNGEADITRFCQVVTNLVSNAIKYGEGGPIEIYTGQRNGRFFLSVKDYGQGIPAEEQARVFERFERNTSDDRISGLGLGLFISKEIVVAHGGEIELKSEAGKGSTFSVYLPLHATKSESVNPKQALDLHLT